MSKERQLSILHRVPGRLRLDVPALRKDEAAAAALAAAVRALPGIRDARGNAQAACLVIEHEPGLPVDDVASRLACVPDLAAWGVQRMSPTPVRRERPRRPLRTTTQRVHAILHTASRVNTASSTVVPRGVDLKLAIPGALAGFGLLRLVSGRFGPTPHWIVFLMYGLDAFALLNQKVIRGFPDAPAAGGASAP